MKKTRLKAYRRRRANRTVFVTLLIASLMHVVAKVFTGTYLMADSWHNDVLNITMVAGCVALVIGLVVAMWARSVLATLVVLAAVIYTPYVGIVDMLYVPSRVIDTAQVDGHTFYLYEAIVSRHNPAVFVGTELVVCEGDSQRLTDCDYLWSKNTQYYATIADHINTTLIVNERAGILTVERVFGTPSNPRYSGTILYEYPVAEGAG
ncbi:MAG: hypothetical protein AAFU54_16770 [Chloroflexota bacterium]